MLRDAIQWCNGNDGFVSVVLFAATLLIAWIGGLFKLLRQKPRFALSIIQGPNFACTYSTGKQHGEHEVTRTFFALYLNVTNRGSAAGTIETVELGYKWWITRLNRTFLKYVLGWCWLPSMISMLDFHYILKSGGAKFYPFLVQRSTILPNTADLYFPIGKSEHGVIYFEQADAWGGCRPFVLRNRTIVKVRITDSFGRMHARHFWLALVTLEYARKYNPAIGTTHDELQ